MYRAKTRTLSRNLPYGLSLLGTVIIALAVLSIVLQQSQPHVTGRLDAPLSSRSAVDSQIDRLIDRLNFNSSDSDSYVQLGNAFLQKARETGDLTYYSRAEESLEDALNLDADNANAMSALGSVALGLHQFQEAESWALRSLSINPTIANTYGVLGDGQLELGDYEAATESYQKMIDLKPSLGSYARAARIRELGGDIAGAKEAMQLAVDAATPGTESAAWAKVELGNLFFESGRLDDAKDYYELSLKDFGGYFIAFAALGKVYAAQGLYDQAIDYYERAVFVIPQPALLAELAILYTIIGDAPNAQLQHDTIGAIAILAEANQSIYNRDLALYYADNDIRLQEALRLAEDEIKFRKDIYGYDALAWALYKNGHLDEAARAIEQALSLGTRDASLYYHAGMIHFDLGNFEQSRDFLSTSLSINPHFSIKHADMASQRLEDIKDALAR